jgi:hypothetical protein
MKGQYFSFDAIIGAVIFIMALVALLSYWHSVKSYLDYQNDPLSTETVRVANLLFTPPEFTPSTSSDCAQLTTLGFAMSWNDSRVNQSLITCAAGLAEPKLQQDLGTSYNVSINVTDISSAQPTSTAIGGAVPAGVQDVVIMHRLATIVNPDGSTYLAKFDLTLYSNSSD